jgi:regulatory protein
MEDPLVPTIVEVRAATRARQRIVALSDGSELTFSDEACTLVGVHPGAPADDSFLAALAEADRRTNAHTIALRLLSVRARSEAELRRRLAMRQIPPPDIDAEIDRLKRVGLLDDEAFAQAWVANRRATAPRGRRLLRAELAGKGIASESVAAATQDLDDSDAALALARSRARGAALVDFETFLARVGGLLRRRGFDYGTTLAATRTAWQEATGEPGTDD